jgi:hypothetical protein
VSHVRYKLGVYNLEDDILHSRSRENWLSSVGESQFVSYELQTGCSYLRGHFSL